MTKSKSKQIDALRQLHQLINLLNNFKSRVTCQTKTPDSTHPIKSLRKILTVKCHEI
jgi:hypothetical protein